MAMLSVIVPAFNEQAGLAVTFKTLEQTLAPIAMPFEILFVDDGSRDETWDIIRSLVPVDPKNRVRGVHFSRNFGKEAAIFAGLEAADGDCVVVMDADLQHPPEKIVEMVELWRQGYEVIEGKKEDRGEETQHLFPRTFLLDRLSTCYGHLSCTGAPIWRIQMVHIFSDTLRSAEHRFLLRASDAARYLYGRHSVRRRQPHVHHRSSAEVLRKSPRGLHHRNNPRVVFLEYHNVQSGHYRFLYRPNLRRSQKSPPLSDCRAIQFGKPGG